MVFEGAVRHPPTSLFGPFSVAFCTPCHCARVQRKAPWLAAPWPCLSCSCACCRALAARPWQVFLVGFEGTVRHPASLNFRLFFGPFLHPVPLRLGLAEGALAGCAMAKPQFSALFRSLFPRRATALGSSGGRLGWLRPGCALAALVLAAGLWLRGPGESS